MMLATERIVFVTGPEDSDRFIENLRTEYNRSIPHKDQSYTALLRAIP